MKIIICLLVLFSSFSYSMIFTISATDGLILIIPRSLQGTTNSVSSSLELWSYAMKNKTKVWNNSQPKMFYSYY